MHRNDVVFDNYCASPFSRHRQKPIVDLELFWILNNRIFACKSVLHKLDSVAIQGMMVSLVCGKAK